MVRRHRGADGVFGDRAVGAVVPYAVADRKTTRVVVEYQGVRSPAVEVPVVSSAPALFTLDSSGKGQAGMLNEKGCCNSARNPAARGSIAALYATGAGQTNPPGIDGSVPPTGRMSDYPVPALPVRVTVGGRPAEILYAGAAPHAVAGLLQVNFRVPADAPTGGAIPLVLTVGDGSSPDGVTMAVRSREQRILVAGDVPQVRDWLGRCWRARGMKSRWRANGPEAVAQAEDHPIDLVICSLGIPEAERTELMRGMLAARPQLKIVATAGVLGPRHIEGSRSARRTGGIDEADGRSRGRAAGRRTAADTHGSLCGGGGSALIPKRDGICTDCCRAAELAWHVPGLPRWRSLRYCRRCDRFRRRVCEGWSTGNWPGGFRVRIRDAGCP